MLTLVTSCLSDQANPLLLGAAGCVALIPLQASAFQPMARDLGGPVELAEPAEQRFAQADGRQSAPQGIAQSVGLPLTPAQQLKGLYVTAGLGANWPTRNSAVEVANFLAPPIRSKKITRVVCRSRQVLVMTLVLLGPR